MGDKLTFGLQFSLEEMARRRVVINLWTESDILHAIALDRRDAYKSGDSNDGILYTDHVKDVLCRMESYESGDNSDIVLCSDRVEDKISNLGLPEKIKKQMMLLVKPIGLQIWKWKKFHQEFFKIPWEYFDVYFLEQLTLTCAGSIDYKKTSEKIVCLKILDIMKRYELACLFCLVDSPVLWEELPEMYRTTFYRSLPNRERQLMYFWSKFMTREYYCKLDIISGLPSRQFYIQAFRCAVHKGNIAATQYFFGKLVFVYTSSLIQIVCDCAEYGSKSLVCRPKFPNEGYGDVLYYLLSLLSYEKKMQVIERNTFAVLTCFLFWHWQDFFFDIADIGLKFLGTASYDVLFFRIEAFSYSGDCFYNFFQTFFLRIPPELRKHFVDLECRYQRFFRKFFKYEDVETIKVVFRTLDSVDSKKLVSHQSFFRNLSPLVMDGKWHLVELCLREGTKSKEDREELKETYMRYLTYDIDFSLNIDLKRLKWNQFFHFFNKTNASGSNKRIPEDKMPAQSKKLCSEEERNVLPRD